VSADLSLQRIPSRLQAIALWFLAGVAMLVVGFGVALASVALSVAGGMDATKLSDPAASPMFSSPSAIAVGVIANEIALAAVLGLALWITKPAPAAVLPVRGTRFLGFAGALLSVFGLAPAADAAAELCHRVVGNEITAAKIVASAAQAATPGEMVLLIVCLALAPALVEEAMFRGYVTAAFARGSMAGALFVPSLMFGLFHLEPTQVAGTIVLGFGFGLARLCTDSLLPGIVAHAVYNGAVIFAVRHSGTPIESHDIELVPILIGLGISALGVLLLVRERRWLSSPATAETRAPPPV
jgi:uncharacterized protein